MIPLPKEKIVGIFGPVASGKTYLVNEWIKTLNTFVVFDATGEFVGRKDMTTIWANPRALYETLAKSPYYFRVAYQPGPDIPLDFHYAYKILWQLNASRYLIVDEFHLVCSVNEPNPDVETIMRFARHAHLGVVGVSQRIADVSKLFTSCCRLVVLFWTQEARDLLAIRDRWGVDVSETVRSLRPLVYDDSNGLVSQTPQCVVYEKGRGARIFDFKTNGFLSIETGLPEREEPSEEPTQSIQEEPLENGISDDGPETDEERSEE